MEKDLKKAKEEAEQINILKSNFIRNMEHDIRTPFSGIYGLSSILIDREKNEETKSLLIDIHNSAKELLDYCNTILDFSNIESGEDPIVKKRFNLFDLVQQVISMEVPSAKLKNLDLNIEYHEDVPKVLLGDDFRIKRILINLISNSIKFTHKGYVKLLVQLAQENQEQRKVVLAITVDDSGIGIPKSIQNRLFEGFIKASPSNKGIYKGCGLGLRIVRQFMNDLGGDIDLVSNENGGTKFTCTIPFGLPLVEDMPEGLTV